MQEKKSQGYHYMHNYLFPETLKKNGNNWEIGRIPISELAKKYETPLYVLDKKTLLTQARKYMNSWRTYWDNFKVLYAIKALPVMEVIRIFSNEGLGALVSTGGELFIALKSGVDPNRIYFHGNAKSLKEIEYAIDANIYALIVDNLDEIEKIKYITYKKDKKVNILVRIIPNIEANTHSSIRTGQMDTKFGLPIPTALNLIESLKEEKHIVFKGIHSHIGSQIFDLSAYTRLAKTLSDVSKEVLKTGVNIEEISIGGGLGIAYTYDDIPPKIEDLAKEVSEVFKNEMPIKFTLICEPGRSLVGRAGITIYEVESRKVLPISKYVSVNGGMSDNPRPVLYGAKYTAIFLNNGNSQVYNLAGKHCESGDILIRNLEGPWPNVGDLVFTLATGAYNFSMFNWYNAVLRPAVVMVDEGKDYLVVKRDTFEDLLRGQL